MASFFDEIARNRIKSIILMLLFIGLFSLIIYVFVLFLGGGLFAFMLGFVLIIAYALFVYFTGNKIILTISGAKIADKKQYHKLYSIVGGLSAAAQVKMPSVYIMNDNNPNAFATGRNKKISAIVVTTGLLNIMDNRELTGVIAHEMSHISNSDIQFMMIAVVFAGIIGLIGAFVRNMFFFGFGEEGRNGGILMLVILVIGILGPIFAFLIKLAISRKREFMADANGARLTRDPKGLSSALNKIKGYSNSAQSKKVKNANEITAPLYFSNPFSKNSIVNILSTHPPIEERIKRLEHMY